MPDFTLKQGDTLPVFEATLKDAAGVVVNLDGATVTLHLRPVAGGNVRVLTATVVDAPNGAVEYLWEDGDTDDAGDYEAEWQAAWPPSDVLTFPNDGYLAVRIVPQLS